MSVRHPCTFSPTFPLHSFSASSLSSSLVLCVLPSAYSLRVYKGRVILRPESFCNRPQTGARQREGDNVVWSFLVFVCTSREIKCGGGGLILGESVSCRRMRAGLPWVNPPHLCSCVRLCVCVCVCVCARTE